MSRSPRRRNVLREIRRQQRHPFRMRLKSTAPRSRDPRQLWLPDLAPPSKLHRRPARGRRALAAIPDRSKEFLTPGRAPEGNAVTKADLQKRLAKRADRIAELETKTEELDFGTDPLKIDTAGRRLWVLLP